jgi:hypothetical protein
VRSAAKSALVLWATGVGNEEVSSTPYADARHFIVNGNEAFNRGRAHLDSRCLPHSDELQHRFGKFFNLIYVRSDGAGRVVAHFTLYNIISWQIVLAEAGGTPNARIGLISDPLDPVMWSDTIADEVNIDFAWLNNPDYSDEFVRARERFEATVRHHVETQRAYEVNRIIGDVFAKHGIIDEHEPIDSELARKITWETSRRLTAHAVAQPHVEEISGNELVARLKAARGKAE